MSGVIGAVGNTFILVAATLMLPVTVNRDRVQGAIDPGLKISVISPQLATRYHLGVTATQSDSAAVALRKQLNIGIGAENFDVGTIEIGRDPCCTDRDVVIGQDILAAHVFEIDFVHRTIRLVLPFEYRRATQRRQAIVLFRGADGSRHLSVQVGASAPLDAILDLANPGALQINRSALSDNLSPRAGMRWSVRSDDTALGDLDIGIRDGKPHATPAVIGMGAFAGSRILLDLPHDRIWIDRKN